MEKQSYAGKIGNTGPQEVKALHQTKSGQKVSVKRGTDLRAGK